MTLFGFPIKFSDELKTGPIIFAPLPKVSKMAVDPRFIKKAEKVEPLVETTEIKEDRIAANQIVIELCCIDPIVEASAASADWTKFTLVNRNKIEYEEDGEKLSKLGAKQGELQSISGKILGPSSFIQQGKKYRVAITPID